MEEELEVEEVVSPYARFRRSNGAYYAFVIAPLVLLNTPVPDGWPWGTVCDGEGEVVRQKYVGEFILMARDLENGTALCSVAAMESPTKRPTKVDETELSNWNTHMEAYGLGIETWLTHEEALPLLDPILE